MPYVNIKITEENVTDEQKHELIKQTTDMLQQVLDKDPATTFVVIDEVPLTNWGYKGTTVAELRRRK